MEISVYQLENWVSSKAPSDNAVLIGKDLLDQPDHEDLMEQRVFRG